MPEFEEAKPVNTKTDVELNSDDFSTPSESSTRHIPSPPRSKPVNTPTSRRRSRYSREKSILAVRPALESAEETPAKERTHSEPRAERPTRRREGESNPNPADRSQRPPRKRQNRNRRGPADNRGESGDSKTENRDRRPNPNRNRNQNRSRHGRGDTARSGEAGERAPDDRNKPAERKAPAKRGILGSIVSTLKSMMGIKEEGPKKEDRPPQYRSQNRPPRRRKNPHQQGNRHRGNREGVDKDETRANYGPPKKFAKKRSRRRRRPRKPENQSTDSSPQPDQSSSES